MTVGRGPDGAIKYGNVYNELLEYVIPVDVTFYTLMVGAVVAFRLKAPHLAPALPDDRVPAADCYLYQPGSSAGGRLHLLEALDLGQRLPDRAGGHSRFISSGRDGADGAVSGAFGSTSEADLRYPRIVTSRESAASWLEAENSTHAQR